MPSACQSPRAPRGLLAVGEDSRIKPSGARGPLTHPSKVEPWPSAGAQDSCTVTEASRGKAGLWAEVGRGAGGGREALNSFRRPGSILRPRSLSLSPFLPTSLHHPAPSFTLPHLCGRAPVPRCYPDLLCLSSPSPTVSPLALPWGDPPRPTALQPSVSLHTDELIHQYFFLKAHLL